jgi:uncharacterized membrane protein
MSELRTRLEPLTAPHEVPAEREPVFSAPARGPRQRLNRPNGWGLLITSGLASVWAAQFAWLAVQRHLAGGSHAEDLGFTDQVLANFLRGQFFRMSIYQGATWNTELDISRLARPDSLLAFHFEPMLLILAPLYAIGGSATLLLVLQAVAVAAGALPAYRLGAYAAGSASRGLAVAGAYLLSPLGQWAVLADFHTATLAAPLLVLAVERLVVKQSAAQALAVAALAATAREDVGLTVAALGVLVLLLCRGHAKAGLAFLGLGLGSTILAALVIRTYSGGLLPFDVRYGATVGAGLDAALAALGRPAVLGYLGTLVLSGGWLGLCAPLALLPALPSLAANLLSASPWMAAGKAHYSSLILPFIAIAATAGLRRLRDLPVPSPQLASGALVLISLVGYLLEGAGPLAGNYAPAVVTAHASRAETLAQSLPATAAVSASSALVPHLSHRPRVFVFPAVLDADFVFLDLQASPAPTSAGDVFMRVRTLLADGGWNVEAADDGLLLLHRAPDAPPTAIGDLALLPQATTDPRTPPLGSFLDGRVSLLSANLLPSPDGAVDVDGPRGVVRLVWRAEQPLPSGAHVDFWLDQRDGQRRHVWDIAPLWWDPPAGWIPGQPVTIDIPDVPMRQFLSWQAVWTTQ